MLTNGAFATAVFAQSAQADLASAPLPQTPLRDASESAWSIFGGYTSHELENAGAHAGAEYSLVTAGPLESMLSAGLQVYHQPEIETGYAVHVRWGQRCTSSFGLSFESFLGVGAQFTQYQTTVFEFANDQGIPTRRDESQFAFAPHVVFGPGYDFSKSIGIPAQVYARPGVLLLYPDTNLTFQASLIAELGVRWAFSSQLPP